MIEKKKTQDSGFTLLEVLIAISILAVVLTALFRMHIQTISMNSRALFNTNAPMLAEKKLAEFAGEKDFSERNGNFGKDFPNYNWKVYVKDVFSEELEEYSKYLKKIEVVVSYNNDEFVYRIFSYKYQ